MRKSFLKRIPIIKLLADKKNLFFSSPYYKKNFFNNNFQKNLSMRPENVRDIIFRFSPLIDQALLLDGCFVECGIGYGRSLQIITSLLIIKSSPRDIYAFDSFEGFPDLSAEDKIGEVKSLKGKWKYVKPFHIKEIISDYINKFPSTKVNLIKGFFEESINDNILEKISTEGGIALLHLDVDLYQSYLTTLNKFWHLVNKKGIIIFDEYHSKSLKKFPGSKTAIDQFLIEKGYIPHETIKTDETGRCYMIKE